MLTKEGKGFALSRLWTAGGAWQEWSQRGGRGCNSMGGLNWIQAQTPPTQGLFMLMSPLTQTKHFHALSCVSSAILHHHSKAGNRSRWKLIFGSLLCAKIYVIIDDANLYVRVSNIPEGASGYTLLHRTKRTSPGVSEIVHLYLTYLPTY